MSSLIDIVYFAIFVLIVLIVVLSPNKITDHNQDLDNYQRVRTTIDKAIDSLVICPPRSKPQTEEGLKEADYKYHALIYRVHSRHEFDTCHAKAANKVAVVECDDRPKESLMSEILVNVFLDEFEEEIDYFFLSVSSDRPRNRFCDDFVVRFSITIDLNADEYFKVAEIHCNLSNKMILSVIF